MGSNFSRSQLLHTCFCNIYKLCLKLWDCLLHSLCREGQGERDWPALRDDCQSVAWALPHGIPIVQMGKQTDNTLLGLFLCLRLTTSNQKSSLAPLILVYLINSNCHHLPMGCIYLSSTERQSFVPLEQISLPHSLVPFPFSLIFYLLCLFLIPCPLFFWCKEISFVLRSLPWGSWADIFFFHTLYFLFWDMVSLYNLLLCRLKSPKIKKNKNIDFRNKNVYIKKI